MVFGHTSIPEPLSKYIWSFHMPFFFLVSGIFYSTHKYATFVQLLKRKIYTLALPYIFFSIIVMLGYYGTEYWHPEELYKGWSGYALWFIPVLFISEMCLYFFAKYATNKQRQYIMIMLLLIVSKVLAINNIHLPFKIDAVPLACSFVFIGYIGKDFSINYLSSYWSLLLVALLSVVLSQILPKTGIGRNAIGWVIPNYVNALFGIFCVMQISRYLNNHCIKPCKNFLLWCGKNTLFILAFSQLFNYWILLVLDKIGRFHIVNILLRYILLFAFIYITSGILKRYVPCLVGQSRG